MFRKAPVPYSDPEVIIYSGVRQDLETKLSACTGTGRPSASKEGATTTYGVGEASGTIKIQKQ